MYINFLCIFSVVKIGGAKKQHNCMRGTQPILDSTKYMAGALPQEKIVRNIIITMSKPVHLLDVAFLSQLKKRLCIHRSTMVSIPGMTVVTGVYQVYQIIGTSCFMQFSSRHKKGYIAIIALCL
jgi:hypothetical protein